MKRLHILFVSEYFHPRRAGGEIWSWGLVRGLRSKGHKITVITSNTGKQKKNETVEGITILRPHTAKTSLMGRYLFEKKIGRIAGSMMGAADIVHSMAYGVNVEVSKQARKKGIPSVTSVHSYMGRSWFKMKNPFSASIYYLIERLNLARDVSDLLQVPSKKLRFAIKKEAKVIHNWVEFKPLNKRKVIANRWIMVGSLTRVKNQEEVIRTLPSGKTLVIVGKGEEEQKLRYLAKGKDVIFKGELPQEETRDLIASSERLIINSFNESYSLVAIDALLMGVELQSTYVGIIPEIVQSAKRNSAFNIQSFDHHCIITPKRKIALADLPALSRSEFIQEMESLYAELVL